jgi:uncharacterized RDD family membrane protein YckC
VRASLIDLAMLVVLALFLTPFLKLAGPPVALVLWFAGIIYFEGGPTGQTVGKSLANLRVVSKTTGEPLAYPGAFKRTLGKIVSTLALGAGDLWMLRNPDRQCWHDKMVDSIVVPVQPRPRRVRQRRPRA